MWAKEVEEGRMKMKYFLMLLGISVIALTSMTCHAPTEPSSNSADTTSNDWAFTEMMLGDGGGSQLYDVSIVNDTLAYAVWAVYLNDSTGHLDPSAYNLVEWNGQTLKPMRLQFLTFCGDPYTGSYPTSAVYSLGPKDTWVASASQIVQWNDTSQTPAACIPVSVNRLWGTRSTSLYAVGYGGEVARYNGNVWQKFPSGTTLNIQDIYGYGGAVLAIASYPGESLDKAILQITGTSITQLSTAGIQWPLSSVWFVPGHYYVVGQGIYEKTPLSQSTWHEDSVDTVDFFSSIRGNAWNDFFVAGGYGQLLHFNGKTWRSYQNILGLQQGG
ncbi:MAG: hypothetical protein B7Z63_06720, partial [Ignavibacteriae bacterium 37-53-5]